MVSSLSVLAHKLWQKKTATNPTDLTAAAEEASCIVPLGAADTTLPDPCSSPMEAHVLSTLGEGAFGHVLKVRLLPDLSNSTTTHPNQTPRGDIAALKVFKSERCSCCSSSSGGVDIMNEMSVLLRLSNLAQATTPISRALHAHTVKPSHLYEIGLVVPQPACRNSMTRKEGEPLLQCVSMELCEGGDLMSHLMELEDIRGVGQLMTEKEAASFFYPVAKAVEFCHWHRFLHLDVKPDNILLRKKGRLETACLSDFSLAMEIPADKPNVALSDLSDTFCRRPRLGTDRFMAPEVSDSGLYSPLADVFSLGCVLLFVLTGASFPSRCFAGLWRHLDAPFVETFISNNLRCLATALGKDGPLHKWDALSPSVKSLITGMLCPDPLRRLNLHQVLCHPWLLDSFSVPSRCRKAKSTSSFMQAIASSCRVFGKN